MQVKFEKLLFVSDAGQPIDISALVVEANVYQSLFEHYMHCEIALKDSIGLARAIPQNLEQNLNGGFSGGELLIMQYVSENNPTITNCFALYDRSARTKLNDSAEGYILSGVSLESMDSFTRKVSKAYGGEGGNTIGDIMNKFISEYIYNKRVRDIYQSLKTEIHAVVAKTVVVEPTSGLQKLIIPNLSVDDTIDFFCNEADSDDHIPNYMFYENYDGFNFVNLSTLTERPVAMDYHYTEFNTEQNKVDQRKIISYRVKKENNILENARGGMFKSKTICIDMLKKSKREIIFDYESSSSKFKKLQPFKHKGVVNTADVNISMLTTRAGHDDSFEFFDENVLPKRIDQFLGNKKSYTKHIFKTYMTVTVPGTTALNVGDVVELSFPIKDGLVDLKDSQKDKELSGKYIITKLRNKFDHISGESRFYTSFECAKDTQIIGD
jgi:hypothetical protein